MRSLLACTVAFACGCAAPAGEEIHVVGTGGKADGANSLPLAIDRIGSEAEFEALSFTGGGVGLMGKSVKFLIDLREPADPTIAFINAGFRDATGSTPQAAQFHFFFARETRPGFNESIASFNDATYWTNEKRFVAGTMQAYQLGDRRLFGIQLYPQDQGNEETILDIVTEVANVFAVPGAETAFVATGPQQTTERVAADIEALGVGVVTIEEILGDADYLPMHLGEAWGHLRVFPQEDELLRATDIPVFDELPLELSVVAGTITRAFQDASSHVNLKSQERGTPNMVLRSAATDHELLARFDDQPVHLVVRADGFDLFPSTDAEVEEKLQEKLNRPWTEMPVIDEDRLLAYHEMCPSISEQCLELDHHYGSKATHLGFLQSAPVLGRKDVPGTMSASFGYDLVPTGFGVPLKFYRDLVDHPDNSELKAALDALIDDEKNSRITDPAERRARVIEVQELFYRATFPEENLRAIEERIAEVMPAEADRLKARSSANAEDIEGFDGAGLYTSFQVRLGDEDNPDGSCELDIDDDDGDLRTRPRTAQCAIKGVYASLWNQRAIEERNFARLDHATAAMGIALVPRYAFKSPVAANTVVVTRVMGAGGVSGYSISSQVDNTLVTNPPPGTLSENTVVAFSEADVPPSFITTRFADPGPDEAPLTARVLSDEHLDQMWRATRAVEEAYCDAKPTYYPGSCNFVAIDPGKPTALDLEYKVLENGELVCKQVREFAGGKLGAQDSKADQAWPGEDSETAGCSAAPGPPSSAWMLVVLALLRRRRRRRFTLAR